MRTRRTVLGDAHVERAESAKTAFDEPFERLITEAARGRPWSGEALMPDCKSTVLRSPRQPPLALDADLLHNHARPGESAIGEA